MEPTIEKLVMFPSKKYEIITDCGLRCERRLSHPSDDNNFGDERHA